MTTNNAPARDLPWQWVPNRNGTSRIRQEPNTKGVAIVNIAQVGARADATYIAHAANAYPQLVAALSALVFIVERPLMPGRAEELAHRMTRATDLLRSLGEL